MNHPKEKEVMASLASKRGQGFSFYEQSSIYI